MDLSYVHVKLESNFLIVILLTVIVFSCSFLPISEILLLTFDFDLLVPIGLLLMTEVWSGRSSVFWLKTEFVNFGVVSEEEIVMLS